MAHLFERAKTMEMATTLPGLREASPEYAEHIDRLNALGAQLDTAESQAAALCRELAAVGEWHLHPSPRLPERPAPTLSERAMALLGPAFVPEPAPPRAPAGRQRSEMRQRYDDLLSDIDALQEAIAALERPRLGDGNAITRSGQLFHQANRLRFAAIEPHFRGAERLYLNALIELGRASSVYGELLNQLRGVEPSVPFRASPLPAMLGDPIDRQSEIRRLLRWGIECGRIAATDLPAEWSEA